MQENSRHMRQYHFVSRPHTKQRAKGTAGGNGDNSSDCSVVANLRSRSLNSKYLKPRSMLICMMLPLFRSWFACWTGAAHGWTEKTVVAAAIGSPRVGSLRSSPRLGRTRKNSPRHPPTKRARSRQVVAKIPLEARRQAVHLRAYCSSGWNNPGVNVLRRKKPAR
jgi:hypothetical protein